MINSYMKTTINYETNTKTCGRCHQDKNLSEFSVVPKTAKTHNQFRDGIKPWCKKCYTEYARGYKRNQREKNKSQYGVADPRHFMEKYQLTMDQIDDMMEQQNFSCAICDEKHKGIGVMQLYVDHCHDTGKVRGLLCFSCNTSLGGMQDDAQRLRKAAQYIESYE